MSTRVTVAEAMLEVYNNRYPGSVPLGIYTRYLPRSAVEREVRNLGMGIIDYYPTATMIGPPWHFYEGYLSEVKNTELKVRHLWRNGKRTERREWETPVGTISGEIEFDPAGAGSEHIIKRYIAEPEDYKIMEYIVENTVIRSNEQSVLRRMEELGGDGLLLGRMDRSPYQKCLIEFAGPERFLIDLFAEPELVRPLLEALERKIDEQFLIAVESEVPVLWQPDNVTSDMTPPNAFSEHCVPFYKKHQAEAAKAGKPYVVHIDGKVKVLRDEIKEAGFDVLESVSIPDMGGDVEIPEAQELFPETVILPNFPSNWSSLEDDRLSRKVREMLESFEPDRAVMLQISEDVPSKEWRRIFPVIAQAVRDFNGNEGDFR
ncbi:MAG: uroporphyrinogen decarboxylase family protein [Spirochaetia bacterium]